VIAANYAAMEKSRAIAMEFALTLRNRADLFGKRRDIDVDREECGEECNGNEGESH